MGGSYLTVGVLIIGTLVVAVVASSIALVTVVATSRAVVSVISTPAVLVVASTFKTWKQYMQYTSLSIDTYRMNNRWVLQ